jgi:hypothetical protein
MEFTVMFLLFLRQLVAPNFQNMIASAEHNTVEDIEIILTTSDAIRIEKTEKRSNKMLYLIENTM